MMSIEFSTNQMRSCFFRFLGHPDTLKSRFVQFLKVQLMKNKRLVIITITMIKVVELMYFAQSSFEYVCLIILIWCKFYPTNKLYAGKSNKGDLVERLFTLNYTLPDFLSTLLHRGNELFWHLLNICHGKNKLELSS